jgi:hypothetical protein
MEEGTITRDEVRQELIARSEARRNSLEGRLQRGFLLSIFALGCVGAVASFFVKGRRTWLYRCDM